MVTNKVLTGRYMGEIMGIRSNVTPRTPARGHHLKEHTGFLVSRSLTLPATPPDPTSRRHYSMISHVPKQKKEGGIRFFKNKSSFNSATCVLAQLFQ